MIDQTSVDGQDAAPPEGARVTRPRARLPRVRLAPMQWRLLAILIPILGTALFLAIRVPQTSRHGMGFHLEPKHKYVVAFLYRGHYADPRFGVLLFDLNSEKATEHYDKATDFLANRTKYSPKYDIRYRDEHPEKTPGLAWHDVSIFDAATEKLHPFGEFEFPKCNGTLVGERFFVGLDHNGVLHALDLEHLDRGTQTLAHRPTGLPLVPVFGTDRFVLIRHQIQEGRANLANPIIRRVELFTVTDQGQIQQVKTWPIGAVNDSNFGACSYFGDQVASISPDCKRIEFHHCEDGRATESFPLPPGFQPRTMDWSFDGDILSIRMPNDAHWFDVVHQRWMPRPAGARRLLHRSDDGERLAFGFEANEGKIVVVENNDAARERAFPATPRSVAFLTGDRVAIMSDQEVASGKLYDLATGEHLQSWRPYAWVTPALAFVFVGYGIWCAAWLWNSAAKQTAVWLDALLIAGAPLLCLTVRAMWVGGTLSLIPMEYARGIAFGAFATSFLWVLLTDTRWAIRLLPPLILSSIFLIVAAFAYVDSPMEGWYFIAFGLLHGTLAAFPWAACLLVGVRLIKDQPCTAEPTSNQNQYRLQDLFLWVLTLSILFASLRLMTDRSGPMQSYEFYAWFVSKRAAILFGISVALLIPLRAVQAICMLVAIAGYLFLVSQCLDRLQSGSAGESFTHGNASGRVLVSAGLTCFVFLTALRLRGYRLRRSLAVVPQT